MKQKLFKSWLMLCLLLVGVSSAWAEDASMGAGTNGSAVTVNNKSAIKVGTSSKGGDMTITVPAGATSLEFYAAAWNGVTGLSLNLTPAANVNPTSVSLTADTGIAGSSTSFSLSGTESSYKFTIALSNITEETPIKLTSSTTKRFVVWGATYTTAIDSRTAVNMTGFSATETTIVKDNTTNTSVTNDQNDWTPSYTYESSNTSVATVSNTGVITAVAKGTAKITASLNIANDDATWKKGATTSKTIDITVNNPSHTAQFSVNGAVDDTNNQTVEEGEAITFPTDPELDDVKFMGWTKTQNYSNATTAPTDLCKSANMGEGDVTYYAVFADIEDGTSEETWSITTDNFDKPGSGSGYTPYNGTHTLEGIQYVSNQVMIQSANVQFQTTNGYLYNKTSFGKITKISVTGTSDLAVYECTSSTTSKPQSGAITAAGNNPFTYTFSGNNGFFFINANGSTPKTTRITVYYSSSTYSNYCTNVVVREISNIAVKTAPTATEYCEGEKFNPAGLEITVNYTEGDPEDIAYAGNESKFSFSPALDAELTNADNQVTITYKGMTCQQTINVRTVSISAPTTTEGTYTVKVGDAEAVTADGSTINALKGQKIVLASTPATGYKIASTAFVVTDEDENEVSVSTAGGQYSFTMPGKNVTIAAKFTQVFTVTAGSCEHGSITAIKDASGNVLTETSKGSTVKVEATADTHYHLTGMYYVKEGDDEHNEISENEGVYSFTMPQSNVTVYATFADDTHYNISWMVNGREAKHEEVFADVPVSAPAVDPIDGKVFRGWVAEEINEATNDEPSYVNVFNLTVTEDKMFYAVFATMEGTPETWEEITSAPEEGIYAICSDSYFMKAEVSSNRFANGSTTPQISDGKLTTAPTEDCIWEISKPDTYYRIKNGSNYAGGTSSKNQGALLNDASADLAKWSISYVTDKFEVINYGRSQASSDNSNKYLRNNTSNGWATYASGTGSAPRFFMKHGGATYSEYTTAPLGIGTISISSVGYTTYFTDKEFTMPKGLEGYVVTPKNSTNITLTKAFEGGETVPASTALLVKGEAGDHDYNITNTGATFVGENCLHGNLEAGTVAEVPGATQYYKLLNGENGLGWYLGAQDGGVFYIGANKAYLALTEAQVKSFVLDFGGEDADAINGIEANEESSTIYNLAGQRVQKAQKGIFIVNGKKVMY